MKSILFLLWTLSITFIFRFGFVLGFQSTNNNKKNNAVVKHRRSLSLKHNNDATDNNNNGNGDKRHNRVGTLSLRAIADGVEEMTKNDKVLSARETAIHELRYEIDANNIFTLLAARAAVCLFESDLRKDAIGEKAGIQASSATNWINDKSAFALQKTFDKLKLQLADERTGMDRDEASFWIRWMKATPAPLVINLTEEFRKIANATISEKNLSLISVNPEEFLNRLGCRLIVLPSGASLDSPFSESPASVIFGKLLYGGVSRYRLLSSSNSNRPPRRAGERTEIKPTPRDNIPVWMQYGGPDRMYEAIDMGPAAVLEVILMPKGNNEAPENFVGENMVMGSIAWKPQNMFHFVTSANDDNNNNNKDSTDNGTSDQYSNTNGYTPGSLSGKERNEAFRSDFRSSIGGLQPQIDAIVRRVLDGRVIRPAEDGSSSSGSSGISTGDGDDMTTQQLSMAAMEAEELKLLGLTPVRGLLLYGPPGCGKTALAREISRALRARTPKIVSAPELLDRWVGGSEKLVRALFSDAEAELAMHNGDATKSALHVIVIDEIDAVFRKRSSSEDSGEATRSSVVNQILAKLDGVATAPNLLLIGMTNRRELLDEALLRPGRLEVQIEIPLPTKEGRREILQIHFEALRHNGRLSRPLCCAIDGTIIADSSSSSVEVGKEAEKVGRGDDDLESSSGMKYHNDNNDDDGSSPRGRKRRAFKNAIRRTIKKVPTLVRPTYDLAADYATGGFSGADIAGLVRCAGSIALARSRRDGNGLEGLLVTLEDVKQALEEVKN